jgi:hypothetical protein
MSDWIVRKFARVDLQDVELDFFSKFGLATKQASKGVIRKKKRLVVKTTLICRYSPTLSQLS